MKPLFEIGEEVILWPAHPELVGLQGEIVLIMDSEYGKHFSTLAGNVMTWKYKINIKVNNPKFTGDWWRETSLRPKPKGNGKTLTEFMDELKGMTVTV